MKSEKETLRLAEILVRSFREELTSEERAVLDSWLAEDEHHQILYEQYAGEKFLKEKTDNAMRIDWQYDYQNFIQKYPQLYRPIHWVRWMKYAAIFILPIALCIFWWINDSGDRLVVQTAEIAPIEKAKPILTLAGGQKMVLTNRINFRETDGTLVAGEIGGLSYKQENTENSEMQQDAIFNNLEIPRGAEYFLLLADGTKIWLNSESVIRYPVNFTGANREVYMEGEAFFEVAKDSLRPFVVYAADARIEVLGTEFNVRNYREEEDVATTLVKGSVRLTCGKNENQIVLKPGEQGNVSRGNGALAVHNVDTYFYTAWKDARFVFRSTRMEELLSTLARWYDLQIFYQNDAVKDICFTGDMERMADFHQLLNIIEGNDLVRFVINERTVTVSLK